MLIKLFVNKFFKPKNEALQLVDMPEVNLNTYSVKTNPAMLEVEEIRSQEEIDDKLFKIADATLEFTKLSSLECYIVTLDEIPLKLNDKVAYGSIKGARIAVSTYLNNHAMWKFNGDSKLDGVDLRKRLEDNNRLTYKKMK